VTVVVSNATPLIALSRIGHFDLLRDLYGQLLITEAVVGEIVSPRPLRPSAVNPSGGRPRGWEANTGITARRILGADRPAVRDAVRCP